MKLKLSFNLENEHFPINYRECVLSFIKLSLSEYGIDYFKKFYNNKDNTVKPYAFSVFFKSPEFKENEIIINNKKLDINFSIADYEASIILYNAFNHQKNKKFSLNRNSWTLKNISMLMEKKIDSNEIIIKFMSPLVVRSRQNQKDFYYSFEHKEFLDILKINIKEQLSITNFPENIVDTFSLEPVKAKKVIVKFYEKKMETSVGIFKMSGDKELLKYLYEAGVGSRHSAGFGMFEIV